MSRLAQMVAGPGLRALISRRSWQGSWPMGETSSMSKDIKSKVRTYLIATLWPTKASLGRRMCPRRMALSAPVNRSPWPGCINVDPASTASSKVPLNDDSQTPDSSCTALHLQTQSHLRTYNGILLTMLASNSIQRTQMCPSLVLTSVAKMQNRSQSPLLPYLYKPYTIPD